MWSCELSLVRYTRNCMAILWGEHQRACQRVVRDWRSTARGRRGIETPKESSFTVEGMDAVLRLPRRRVKRVSLIYYSLQYRPVAFARRFIVLSRVTKPRSQFVLLTARTWQRYSARQSRACAWWGGPPYDRYIYIYIYTSRVTDRRTTS